MSHIFISYARKDIDLAGKIVQALAESDLDTWIDWKSIPKGEDWEQEIYRGVEEADAFLFLISPDSVASQMCNKEIAHAVKNGKRILPIFIANVGDRGIYSVTEKFLHKEQKEEINRRNFIICREGRDDFEKTIGEIRTTIHTDYEWLKYHTELQVKALKWDQQKDNSRLLRGKELREAEEQLAGTGSLKDPQPTELQRQYILISQRNEVRQRRQITTSLGVGLAIVTVLAVFAWNQRDNALNSEATAIAEANAKATALINEESAQATAQAEKQHAEEQANIAHAGELAALARVHATDQPDLSFLLGVEAFRHFNNYETRNSLLTSLQTNSRMITTLRSTTRSAFGQNGDILASATIDDNSITLWDTSDPSAPSQIGKISTGDEGLYTLAFNSNRKLLASGDADGGIALWDVSNPTAPSQSSAPVRKHTDYVESIAFRPDGKILASGSSDMTVILWDISNSRAPAPLGKPLTTHTSSVDSVAFSPDGKILASGSFDDTIILWDVSEPAAPIQLGVVTYSSGILSIAFSPDGRILASGNDDNTVTLWDVSDPSAPVEMGLPFTAHKESAQSVFDFVRIIAFSPNGTILASGNFDHTITLWDISNPVAPSQLGLPLTGHTSGVWNLSFSGDGRMLVSSDGSSTILWDASKIIPSAPYYRYLAGETKGVTSLAYGSDSKIMASGNEDSTITLWNVSDPTVAFKMSITSTGIESRVLSVAIDPDGKILAAASEDGTILLWDVSDPRNPVRFENAIPGYILTLNPQNKILASDSQDGMLTLWDITNPDSPRRLNEPAPDQPSGTAGIGFNPDGNVLVTARDVIVLWDVSDPSKPLQLNKPIGEYPSGIPGIAIAPDGNILVSGSYDRTIAFWDISNPAAPIRIGDPLRAHTGPVISVAFSPSIPEFPGSNLLASGSSDTTTILWDVSNAVAPLQYGSPLAGQTSGVSSVAFSPNGKVLASGSWDGSIILWNIDPSSWSTLACQKAGRNFTQAEWQQYFPNEPYRLTCPQYPAGQ